MSSKLWTVATIAVPIALAPGIAESGQAQPQATVPSRQAGAPHVFGTIALPLKGTRFDKRWRRVSRSGATPRQLTPRERAARRATQVQKLSLVNASLNRRIRYRHDSQPSGDHWSTISETLRRSSGDCEDYAIAKLQLLKMLGLSERDLFMTIGHDGPAGAVHAVLVARLGDRFLVLDNRTSELIPHDQYRNFYPIISFGAQSSWLHGYERGKTPAAVKAIGIALQSGRDLGVGDSRGSARPRAARR